MFSGGEPTTQKALLPALQNTREQGFKNALHTGAPHLNLLKPLLPWLDWVGLDIKAMPAAYEAVTTSRYSRPESWGAIAELQRAEVSFECRMTWHRALHTREEVVSIGKMLSQRGVGQFALQIARPKPMLNPAIGDARVTVDDKRHVRAELDACFEALRTRDESGQVRDRMVSLVQRLGDAQKSLASSVWSGQAFCDNPVKLLFSIQ